MFIPRYYSCFSVTYVQLFVTPWTAACQGPLFFTISRNLLKFISVESVMPSNHLILCHPPCPFAFNRSQHQGLLQWVGSSHQLAKVVDLQLQHQSFQWIFRADLLKIDWLNLLAAQGTLKSLLQHHNLKASILWCLVFFMVQLSYLYLMTGKTKILNFPKNCYL